MKIGLRVETTTDRQLLVNSRIPSVLTENGSS